MVGKEWWRLGLHHYSHFELDNGACLALLTRIMRRSTAYVDGGFSVDRRGGFLAFAMGALR